MSAKTDVIWFRYKFRDDVKTRAAVISAADRLFRSIPGVRERRQYTEEEVVGMVKAALLSARAAEAPGQALDGSSSPDVPSAEQED